MSTDKVRLEAAETLVSLINVDCIVDGQAWNDRARAIQTIKAWRVALALAEAAPKVNPVTVPAYRFKEYCACGGFAAGMNGRDLKQPHMDWCPQLPEWLAYRAGIDAATKENAK